MFWNLIRTLRAASDAAHKGAEAALGAANTELYKSPETPVGSRILEESKRNGFEVDRERLQEDMAQIGMYFDKALERLGLGR